MKMTMLFALLIIFQLARCFTPSGRYNRKAMASQLTSKHPRSTNLLMTETKESEPIESKDTKKEEVAIPTYLPSDMGIDYGKFCVHEL